jgi:hypothetical protein
MNRRLKGWGIVGHVVRSHVYSKMVNNHKGVHMKVVLHNTIP